MAYWMPDMTSAEIEQCGVVPVLLPIGSLEQHGAHLPLSTDSLVAEAFARAIADQVGALVAPGFGYGYRSQPASGGGEIFPATTSLSGEGLMRVTSDVLSSLARHGYDELVLVNGHYENSAFIVEAATLVSQAFDVRLVSLNWWELLPEDRLDELFEGEFPGWAAEHAGIAETSLMMHLYPDRVASELIRPGLSEITPPSYTTLPERPGLVDPSGVLRTAHGSSAAIGQNLFDQAVETAVEVLHRELRSLSKDDDVSPRSTA